MKTKIRVLLILHLFMAVYSLTNVAAKFAGQADFLSFKFILFYGIDLFGLFIYAIGWQQIIKHLPLITAYANRGVTVIWGIIWGYFIFNEPITIQKIAGAVIIVAGIVLIVTEDAKEETKDAIKEGTDDKTS